MLPFWTSYLIRTYAWLIILRDDGVVNGLLMQTGLIDSPVEFIGEDFSVILGMTYGFLPFTILPLFVSIDRLDFNLVQAARDLYASGRGAFLHVTLPLTMPGIVAASLLTLSRRSATSSRRTCSAGPDHDDREDRPDHLHDGARLAVRRGARLCAHGDHDRRHAACAPQPAA